MLSPPVRDWSDLKWLAVDLDGTLAGPVWPQPGIGLPIPRNVAKVRRAKARGWKIVIHTARSWGDYEAIEVWARCNDIPIDAIVCGKLLAAWYIDDRNVMPDAAEWPPDPLEAA